MPLSDENAAIFKGVMGADFRFAAIRMYQEEIERLLNACRLEERAKAEGEVEATFRALEGRDEKILALEQRVAFLTADHQAAEARIAELTQERDDAREIAACFSQVERFTAMKVRATQAEERFGEAVKLLGQYQRWLMTDAEPSHIGADDMRVYHLDGGVLSNLLNATRDYLAKLKAAPLQGEGSSSASSTENSPSGRTSAQSSTGKEG